MLQNESSDQVDLQNNDAAQATLASSQSKRLSTQSRQALAAVMFDALRTCYAAMFFVPSAYAKMIALPAAHICYILYLCAAKIYTSRFAKTMEVACHMAVLPWLACAV